MADEDPQWYKEYLASGVPAYKAPATGGDEDVAGYIRQAASKRGIDPEVAIRVAQSEGGLVPNKTGSFKTGKSFWPFQLHYGGPGYESFGNVAGMGNTFTAQTGYQPGDPSAWRAATDYALDAAAKNGWGAWYGARNVGVTGRQGIGTASGARETDPGFYRGAGADDTDPQWYREFMAQQKPAQGAPQAPRTPQPAVDEGDPAWYKDAVARGLVAPPEGGQGRGAPGGTVWPVAGEQPGAVNNPFGAGQSRAAGTTVQLPSSNVGADLRGKYGAAVVAPVSGTVLEVFDAPDERDRNTNHGWGGMTLLRGDDGFTHRLSHAQPGSVRARPGQRVEAGQHIQNIGLSGNTTGPHLDYEKFSAPGRFVDPTAGVSSPSRGAAPPQNLTVEAGDPQWFKDYVAQVKGGR